MAERLLFDEFDSTGEGLEETSGLQVGDLVMVRTDDMYNGRTGIITGMYQDNNVVIKLEGGIASAAFLESELRRI